MDKNKQSISRTFFYSFILVALFAAGIPFYFWIQYLLVDKQIHIQNLRDNYIVSQKMLLKSQVENVIKTIEIDKADAEKKLKKEIKERVLEAYNTCSLIYKQNVHKVSKEKLYILIHDALWYREWDGGTGYIFAEHLNGVEYINRNNPELEGVDISNLQDDKGTYLVKDIINIAKTKGEGYCSYYWNIPGKPDVLTKKISFVKIFKPLNIVIGSGKYLEDMENEIQKEVLDRISRIVLGDGGYFFAGNWDGVSLTEPVKGKNMLSVSDPNGVKIVQELIKVSKIGGGFVSYVLPKFKGKRPDPKLSYASGIKDWEWYIGAGKYVDEIEALIKRDELEIRRIILRALIKVIILYILIILSGLFLVKWFSNKLNFNISRFVKAFKNIEKGKGHIKADEVNFSEFYEIAESANRMFKRQKKAEKALAVSEKRFKDVIENAHIPIMIVNLDNNIEYLNSEFTQLYGYALSDIPTIESLIDSACDERKYEKEFSDICKKLFYETQDEKESLFEQFIISCKDSSELRTVEISSSIIGDLRIYIFLDITERLKVEKEKELFEQRKHQSQKMEAIGLMAGGVAHDLNNILSGIVGYPEMLLADMDKKNPLYKPMEIINQSAFRASAVVADLVTVARGVASKKKIVDLNELIKDYFKSPEFNKIKSHHEEVKFDCFYDSDLMPIRCSEIHIRKVIMNLIINAMEAVNHPGKITITTESIYLDRPIKGYTEVSEGEYSTLSVLDNGPGIRDEDLERIFEPFYTKKVMGRSGTGLGLSVVWNTVNDHNGYIDVQSSEKGSLFKVYFPASREELDVDVPKVELNDLKGNEERILVIDDESNQRKISTALLERLNYNVDSVSSGEAALNYLKDKQVDLLLLDMIMDPGMNGAETFNEILKINPKQKAIIASGFARTKDVEDTIQSGAGEYIKKPYTIRILGRAVKKVLEA